MVLVSSIQEAHFYRCCEFIFVSYKTLHTIGHIGNPAVNKQISALFVLAFKSHKERCRIESGMTVGARGDRWALHDSRWPPFDNPESYRDRVTVGPGSGVCYAAILFFLFAQHD
jgi:hypothetical protein